MSVGKAVLNVGADSLVDTAQRLMSDQYLNTDQIVADNLWTNRASAIAKQIAVIESRIPI